MIKTNALLFYLFSKIECEPMNTLNAQNVLNDIPVLVSTQIVRYFVYKKGTNERFDIYRGKTDFPGFPTELGCKRELKGELRRTIRDRILHSKYGMVWNDPKISKLAEDFATQLLSEFEVRKVIFTF